MSILKLAERVRDLVNPQATIQHMSYREAYDDSFEDIRRRVPDLTAFVKRSVTLPALV